MNFYFSPYLLKLKTGGLRKGALLKVSWGYDQFGYADLHPLPERGDLPLEQQLHSLYSPTPTPICQQALSFAFRDAEARKKNLNLLKGKTYLNNNYLIMWEQIKDIDQIQFLNSIWDLNFKILKIKVTPQIAFKSLKFLELAADRGFLLRLDMNGSFSKIDFNSFLSKLSSQVKKNIQYIEDPMPFEYSLWQWLWEQFMIPLALDEDFESIDWNHKSFPFQTLILKPARQKPDLILSLAEKRHLKVTVTSSMDHIIGSLYAYLVALDAQKDYSQIMLDPGCLTHTLFEEDEFSSSTILSGPQIIQTHGLGIGFDSILKERPWYQLKEQ